MLGEAELRLRDRVVVPEVTSAFAPCHALGFWRSVEGADGSLRIPRLPGRVCYLVALPEGGRSVVEPISEVVDHLARLALVARALTATLRPSEVIDIVVHQGMDGLGAAGGVLARIDADGAVVPLDTVGYTQEAVTEFAPMNTGQELPITVAARDLEPVWVPSRADAASRFPALLTAAVSASQAWAAIPLVVDGSAIGVLGVTFSAPREFSERERLFITTLGDQCALALAAHRAPASESFGIDDPAAPADPWRRAARALSYAMFAHSLDAVMFTAPDGQILAANPAACQTLGLSEQEIRRRGRSGLADLSDTRWATGLGVRESTGRFSGELRMLRGDGSAFTADVSSAVFENEVGELRTVVVFRDTTDPHNGSISDAPDDGLGGG